MPKIQKYIVEKKRISTWNATAYNERFAKMAGVLPLKSRCELVTPCLADSSVRPATSPSRYHVSGKRRTAQRQPKRKTEKPRAESGGII